MRTLKPRTNEHKDDYLNRLLLDPLADRIKMADRAGFTGKEIREAVSNAFFHAYTEIAISEGMQELKAERVAFAKSREIVNITGD